MTLVGQSRVWWSREELSNQSRYSDVLSNRSDLSIKFQNRLDSEQSQSWDQMLMRESPDIRVQLVAPALGVSSSRHSSLGGRVRMDWRWNCLSIFPFSFSEVVLVLDIKTISVWQVCGSENFLIKSGDVEGRLSDDSSSWPSHDGMEILLCLIIIRWPVTSIHTPLPSRVSADISKYDQLSYLIPLLSTGHWTERSNTTYSFHSETFMII